MLRLFKMNINYDSRILGLDLMRCLAILIVLFGHSWVFFEKWLWTIIPGTETPIGTPLFNLINGFDGVDLFFVLSGFLIGTILIKLYEKTEKFDFATVLNFWKRRWLRTVPAYIFFLSLNIGLAHFTFKAINGDWTYFLFLQNFTEGGLAFFPESWSLSIEEWFYMTLPSLLVIWHVFTKNSTSKKNRLLIYLIIYLLLASVFRFTVGLTSDILSLNDDIRTVVLMRLDTIGFGVLMAWLKLYRKDLWNQWKNWLFTVGLVLLIINFYVGVIEKVEWYRNTVYYSFVGLGMALLIPKFYSIQIKAGWFRSFVVITSLVSYSMYLINYSILLKLFERYMRIENVGQAFGFGIAFLLILYLLSILSYKYVEQPFIKLRERITKKDAQIKE